MAEEVNIEAMADEPEPDETRYTAFEMWEYHQLLYEQGQPQQWIDLTESFYRASEVLIDGAATGTMFEDIEGVAGVFAFRHFLELALKGIVAGGRWLVEPHVNATREEFKAVEKEHDLRVLWSWVLRDAKPKLEGEYWENYDTAFVEACINEFDDADKKGFTFRYPGQGCERYRYDFIRLHLAIRHVRLVLNGIAGVLHEMFGQNADWETELRNMAE